MAPDRAGRTLWHSGNDGAGAGLDADLLDGEHASDLRDFARLLNRPATYPPAPHAHAAADLAGAFPASLSDNCYVMLPNGLILQWLAGAQQAAGTSGAQVLTLPIAFPNRCLHASVSTRLGDGGAPSRSAYFVTSVSATG